jgi:hypothetical protein
MDDLSVVDSVHTKHRMDVKLGEHSFTVEGSEEKCDEQFQRFLNAVSLANAAGNQSKSIPKRIVDARTGDQDGDDGASENDIERAWDRAYKRKDDRLSLITLPSTKAQKADALILIMYGFQTLYNQDAATATDIMDAAKQSGLRIDRIDRNLPVSYKAYYNRGGTGKGMRYSLNNVGLRYAQSILEEMYDA